MSKKKEKKMELLSSRVGVLLDGIDCARCSDYELNGKKGYVQGYLACMHDLDMIDEVVYKARYVEVNKLALLSSLRNNPKMASKLADFGLSNR